MTHSLRNGLAKLLAGIAIVGFTGAWAIGEVRESRETVRRDQQEVARMTKGMKTVCVGRFLIDMPEEARLELTQPRIDGFDIASFDEAQADFRKRLAQREARLRATPDRLGGNRNLESVRDVATESGVVGKIFVHSRTISEGTRMRGLELERYRDEGVAIEALVHGNGMSFDISAPDYDPDLLDNLPMLVAKLVPNPANKPPAEPGFCLDRAWFRDPLTPDQGEEIMMLATLPSHPDIGFMTILAAGHTSAAPGLLERSAQTEAGLSPDARKRVSRLRARQRAIAGMTGDELVRRVVETNDAIGYSFWWEAAGTDDKVHMPHVVFRMTTGEGRDGPVPTSLSQEAALALWDTISSSIRLRPSQAPRPVASGVPHTALGAYARAGEHCPESGWWLCGDGGNGIGVLGGQRQYIRKGERMPQALLLPPQTLWEKLRGVQPSFESTTRTAWKLVDKRHRKRVPPPLPLAQAVPVAAAAMSGDAGGPRTIGEQGVPVGSFAATGLPCPASGWWRCEDPRALDGTRWFARGSLLPSATFALPPGAFGRPAHGAQSIERRGAWRLVRLADAPVQAPGA